MLLYTLTESCFKRNPLRIERTIKYCLYGSDRLEQNINFGTLADYEETINSGVEIKKLSLIGLTAQELENLPKSIFKNVEELDLFYAKYSLKFIEEIKTLKVVRVNCDRDDLDPNDRVITLWDVSKNPVLEKLILGHPEITDISKLENSTISHFEIERGRYFLEDDLPFKIKTDFSVFLTMKNLRVLKLWVEPIKDNYSNLVALSKLTELEEIYLPKHYFTFAQFAYLKSKLKKAKGLSPFREFRNRQKDRFEYMRVGSETPREFVPMSKELYDIDVAEYEMLAKEFENIDTPPKK